MQMNWRSNEVRESETQCLRYSNSLISIPHPQQFFVSLVYTPTHKNNTYWPIHPQQTWPIDYRGLDFAHLILNFNFNKKTLYFF